mgnify:CR=1 FL=1
MENIFHGDRKNFYKFSVSIIKEMKYIAGKKGQGQFIESPRTGETIRVSTLSEPFWQDHYLGARRILTENTIL